MKAKINILIVAIILFTLVAPYAQGALVICGRHAGEASGDCTPDQLVNGVVRIMNFLIDSATLLAIAYVLYGGINMILARGNSAKFESAKATMSSAIQGLLMVLGAYLIISFAIAFLTGGKTIDQILNFLPHQ
jgi:hypothetical protein